MCVTCGHPNDPDGHKRAGHAAEAPYSGPTHACVGEGCILPGCSRNTTDREATDDDPAKDRERANG